MAKHEGGQHVLNFGFNNLRILETGQLFST